MTIMTQPRQGRGSADVSWPNSDMAGSVLNAMNAGIPCVFSGNSSVMDSFEDGGIRPGIKHFGRKWRLCRITPPPRSHSQPAGFRPCGSSAAPLMRLLPLIIKVAEIPNFAVK